MTQPIIGLHPTEQIGQQVRVLVADSIPLEGVVIDGSALTLATPTIVAANGGKLLRVPTPPVAGDYQIIQPGGGLVDDALVISTAMALGPVKCVPGPVGQHFKMRTVQRTPNNSILTCAPGVVFDDLITTTGAVTDAVFGAGTLPGPQFGNIVTPAKFASNVFKNSVTYPVGKPLKYANGDIQGSIYTCISSVAAGDGNFLITVDRPIGFSVPATQALFSILNDDVPQNIWLFFNGATILGGGGNRAVEFLGARDVWIFDLNVDRQNADAVLDIAMSFDVGCVNVGAIRCKVRRTHSNIALAGESAESLLFDHCEAHDVDNGLGTAIAVAMVDCLWSTVREGKGYNAAIGMSVSSDGANGCIECRVEGGDFSGNTVDGVIVTQGSTRTVLTGVRANGNGANGFHVVSDTAACEGTQILGCSASTNVVGGKIDTTLETIIKGFDVTGNQQAGLWCVQNSFGEGTGVISQNGNDLAFTPNGGIGAGVFVDNGADWTFSGCRINNTTAPGGGFCGFAAGEPGAVALGPAVARLNNCTVTLATVGSRGFQANGGTSGNGSDGGQLYMTSCKCVTGSASLFGNGFFYDLAGNVFGTTVSASGPGVNNRFNFVDTGGALTGVPFAIHVNSFFTIRRVTSAGTGAWPTVTLHTAAQTYDLTPGGGDTWAVLIT